MPLLSMALFHEPDSARMRFLQGSLSKPSQKSAPQRQGLQSLGKIPTARRAPANLPSLRAETKVSDNAPAAPSVPATANAGSSQTHAASSSSSSSSTNNINGATWAPNEHDRKGEAANGDKGRLAGPGVAARGGKRSSFLHQASPLFGQEFPSLNNVAKGGAPASNNGVGSASSGGVAAPSSGFKDGLNAAAAAAGGGGGAGGDVQYGPGPSLRPQTSGNWIFGGGAKFMMPTEPEHMPVRPQQQQQSNDSTHRKDDNFNKDRRGKPGMAAAGFSSKRESAAAPLHAPPPSIIDNEKLRRMDLIDTREEDDDWTRSDETFDYNRKLARYISWLFFHSSEKIPEGKQNVSYNYSYSGYSPLWLIGERPKIARIRGLSNYPKLYLMHLILGLGQGQKSKHPKQ